MCLPKEPGLLRLPREPRDLGPTKHQSIVSLGLGRAVLFLTQVEEPVSQIPRSIAAGARRSPNRLVSRSNRHAKAGVSFSKPSDAGPWTGSSRPTDPRGVVAEP